KRWRRECPTRARLPLAERLSSASSELRCQVHPAFADARSGLRLLFSKSAPCGNECPSNHYHDVTLRRRKLKHQELRPAKGARYASIKGDISFGEDRCRRT